MKYGELIVERKEGAFLKQLIGLAKYYKDNHYKASIFKLNEELKIARIVERKDMPDDVIRLNSIITIQTPFAVEKTYQIVTPEKSDIQKNQISILAPMGLALFGYAEGDEIIWQFPIGERNIKIIKVKQVESDLLKKDHDRAYTETSQ